MNEATKFEEQKLNVLRAKGVNVYTNSRAFDLELWLDSLPKPKLQSAVNDIIYSRLLKYHGNQEQTAQELGCSRKTINYRFKVRHFKAEVG